MKMILAPSELSEGSFWPRPWWGALHQQRDRDRRSQLLLVRASELLCLPVGLRLHATNTSRDECYWLALIPAIVLLHAVGAKTSAEKFCPKKRKDLFCRIRIFTFHLPTRRLRCALTWCCPWARMYLFDYLTELQLDKAFFYDELPIKDCFFRKKNGKKRTCCKTSNISLNRFITPLRPGHTEWDSSRKPALSSSNN